MPLFPLAGLLSTALLLWQLDPVVLLIGIILTALGAAIGWWWKGEPHPPAVASRED